MPGFMPRPQQTIEAETTSYQVHLHIFQDALSKLHVSGSKKY
jgi:hypothetical protein